MPALQSLTPGGSATEIGIAESVALQGPRAASGRGDLGGPDGLDSLDVLDVARQELGGRLPGLWRRRSSAGRRVCTGRRTLSRLPRPTCDRGV